MNNILIADDHRLVRQVLRNTFREGGFHVVAEAETAEEAVARARESAPDIAVLDIGMPGDFLKTIETLKALDPPPRILVLTASEDQALAIQSMRAGADGFLRKTAPAKELLEALERLRGGGKYVSAELACLLALDQPQDMHSHERLSTRELEVLKLLGKTRSVTDIGDDLGLSFKTVSTYRSRILEKMSFENNTDIIRYCMQHSLS